MKDNIAGDNKIIFKVKLMAKGFIQEIGVDYNKVFLTVAKFAIMRLVCALIAIFSLAIN